MIFIRKLRLYSGGSVYPSLQFTLTIASPGYYLDKLLLFLKMGATYPQVIQFKEPNWNGSRWIDYDDVPF